MCAESIGQNEYSASDVRALDQTPATLIHSVKVDLLRPSNHTALSLPILIWALNILLFLVPLLHRREPFVVRLELAQEDLRSAFSALDDAAPPCFQNQLVCEHMAHDVHTDVVRHWIMRDASTTNTDGVRFLRDN